MRAIFKTFMVIGAVTLGMRAGPGITRNDVSGVTGSYTNDCDVDGTSWYDCNIWNNDPYCTGGNLVGKQRTSVADDLYQFVAVPNAACTDPECQYTDHLYGFTGFCNQ